jgi:DNA-binding transcriptional ArsR family regulator
MLGGNERDEELRKLREELEELKEHLMKISKKPEAPEAPPKEPVEVPIEEPDEWEEPPEPETPEVVETDTPEEAPPRRRRWEEDEDYRRHRGRDFDFGDRLGDYISGFVEDVMEGVAEEIEHSLFISPRGPRMVVRGRRSRRKPAVDEKRTASIMSALGNEYRLKILDSLSTGGMYASDLQEALEEISPSTLSSHLDVLEEAGLIMQERRRGRYLITIPGRLAIKMAYQIARRTKDESPEG